MTQARRAGYTGSADSSTGRAHDTDEKCPVCVYGEQMRLHSPSCTMEDRAWVTLRHSIMMQGEPRER